MSDLLYKHHENGQWELLEKKYDAIDEGKFTGVEIHHINGDKTRHSGHQNATATLYNADYHPSDDSNKNWHHLMDPKKTAKIVSFNGGEKVTGSKPVPKQRKTD